MTDRARAEAAMKEFLLALGHRPEEAPVTAARVTAAYVDELLSGYSVDVRELILSGSELVSGEVDPVLVDNIETATVCPHHLLVARGTALLAYHPGERVLGLGTLTRVVDAIARRMTLQETIAGDVVNALMEHAGARGVFCRLTLAHACLQTRGACQATSEAVTWASAGTLKDPEALGLVLGRELIAADSGKA